MSAGVKLKLAFQTPIFSTSTAISAGKYGSTTRKGLLQFPVIGVAILCIRFRVNPFEKRQMTTSNRNRDDAGTFVAVNFDDTFCMSFDQICCRLSNQHRFLNLLHFILPPVNRRDRAVGVSAGGQAALDQIAANRLRFRRITRGYIDQAI